MDTQVIDWERRTHVGLNRLMGSQPFLHDNVNLQRPYRYKQTMKTCTYLLPIKKITPYYKKEQHNTQQGQVDVRS